MQRTQAATLHFAMWVCLFCSLSSFVSRFIVVGALVLGSLGLLSFGVMSRQLPACGFVRLFLFLGFSFHAPALGSRLYGAALVGICNFAAILPFCLACALDCLLHSLSFCFGC